MPTAREEDEELERELAEKSTPDFVAVGFTADQAEVLAGLVAHLSMETMKSATILGNVAIVLLIDPSKVPREAGLEGLRAVMALRDIAKQSIREELGTLMAPQMAELVEHALSGRWAELVAQIRSYKKGQ